MKTLKNKFALVFLMAALAACSPDVHKGMSTVEQPVQVQQYAPPPVQAAGQPVQPMQPVQQVQQTDSGYSGGTVAAAVVGGAIVGALANKALSKPETKTVYVDRPTTRVVESPKPATIQPTYTPKPVTTVQKPVQTQSVAPKSNSWSNRSSSFSSSRSSGRR